MSGVDSCLWRCRGGLEEERQKGVRGERLRAGFCFECVKQMMATSECSKMENHDVSSSSCIRFGIGFLSVLSLATPTLPSIISRSHVSLPSAKRHGRETCCRWSSWSACPCSHTRLRSRRVSYGARPHPPHHVCTIETDHDSMMRAHTHANIMIKMRAHTHKQRRP